MKSYFALLFISFIVNSGTCILAESPPPLSYITIDQMLQRLPVGLKLRKGNQWQQQAAELANDALYKDVVGKEARMQLTFPKYMVLPQTIRGTADIPGLTVNGVPVTPVVNVYYRLDQLPLMGLTTARRTDVLTGKITRASFTKDGAVFNLDITEAKLENVKKPVSAADLRQPATPLVDQRWPWGAGSIQFGADGLVRTGDGEWERRGLVTSWKHLGNGNVLLKIEKGRSDQLISLLQFNSDWTTYSGWSFDGTEIKEVRKAALGR